MELLRPPVADSWLRLIAEHSRDLVLLLDLNGTILYASPSNLAVVGIDPATMLGRPVSEFIHPDDREIQRNAFSERLRSGETRRVEIRIPKADGSWLLVESVGVPIRDADGKIEAVVVSGRDVSDRKKWEEQLRERERRLRLLLDQTPAALWATDADLIVTYASGGVLADLQLEGEGIIGQPIARALKLLGFDMETAPMHERALRGEELSFEKHLRNRVYHARIEPLRSLTGEFIGTAGIAIDVTDRRNAERDLARSEARYRTLFERNLAGVYRSTLDGALVECNPAFARVLGYDSVEELMAVPTWQHYFTRADREEVIAALRENTELLNFEIRLRRKDGSPVWVLQNEALVYDSFEQTHWMEGTVIDITDRKRAEERIEHQAYHDSLTDLPNRLLFNDRLRLALARSRRHETGLAVMFLDLDHFKLINDTMAHSAGDELLRMVATRLKSVIRSEDTVARMGGDEFTILIPDLLHERDAAKLAQAIIASMAEPFFIQKREVFVTASIGISMYPIDGDDPETLVKNADSAMYRAKDQGRDNYQFHMPLAQKNAEVRLTLETDLRHAVDRGEFFLEYQPQVALATGRIQGFEALIRWRHPERGVISPAEFIPVAEEIGLIIPIGDWVLRTACQQVKRWQTECGEQYRMAVNLSLRQFQNPSFMATVERVLRDLSLEPQWLDLEITESVAMRDAELTKALLRRFKAIGIGVSIDDFGTGYSSLAYLKNLPLDRLKIDQFFIREIAFSGRDEAIVDAIIKMAHSMGLSVVAEGVETIEQQLALTRLGCDEMQGFLFSRPIGVEAMKGLLESRPIGSELPSHEQKFPAQH